MIGGVDIVLPNPWVSPAEVMDAVVRSIRRRWRHPIVQDGATGKRFASFAAIPFRDLRELFVYRDQATLESWEKLGADASNVNSMLHLIADETEFTLVVDDPNDATVRSIRDEIEQLLRSGTAGWLDQVMAA